MKNKRGFTLIELLTVIAILAVVLLICAPTILGVLDKAKKNTFKNQVLLYVDSLKKQMTLQLLNESEMKINWTGTVANVDIKDLPMDSSKDYEGTIEVAKTDEGYTYRIIKISGDGYKIENVTSVEEAYIEKDDGTSISLYKDEILNGADPIITRDSRLVAVKIANDGTVTKANVEEEWYNYNKQEWANAVILVDSPSKEYSYGDTILESDIESYFVWVPRYRYKLFNVDGTATAGEHEIEVIFESRSTSISNGSKNGEYLTHPAFVTFNTNGIWVGKYETGYKGAASTSEAQKNENNSNKVIIKPNVYSWRSIQPSKAFQTSYNYERSLNSHMMKNMEWGAVAYLSHSKYGIKSQIRINNNSNYVTGCAASSENGTSVATCENAYNTTTGYLASTTGNITGIYDMSGGAWEYVMGVLADKDGNPYSGRSSLYNSGYNGLYSYPNEGTGTGLTSGISFPDKKYYDLYENNNGNLNGDSWRNYTGGHLGDATLELVNINGSGDRSLWYSDYAGFVTGTYPWVKRGGVHSHGTGAGVFYFARAHGTAHSYNSFRLVLAY